MNAPPPLLSAIAAARRRRGAIGIALALPLLAAAMVVAWRASVTGLPQPARVSVADSRPLGGDSVPLRASWARRGASSEARSVFSVKG